MKEFDYTDILKIVKELAYDKDKLRNSKFIAQYKQTYELT